MASRFPRRKLLLVEDDNSLRSSLKEFLLRAGYSVQAVKNAHEALAIVSCFRPQVLVCNARLSTISGADLALELLKCMPSCKIVLLLANSSGDVVSRADIKPRHFHVVEGQLPPSELLSKLDQACSPDSFVGPAAAS